MSTRYTSELTDIKHKIYRFSLSLLGNIEEAKDVTQDVLLRLWTEKLKYSSYDNIEGLALKMSKNLSLNILQHKKMRVEKHNTISKNSNNEHRFETQTDAIELSKIVKQLIEALPEKQKMTIHLRDVEGLSFDEIAKATEMDVKNVRMNLSRARKTIKEQLTKIENYGL